MSKARKARPAANAPATQAPAKSEPESGPDLENSLMSVLLETAIMDAGEEQSILSIAGEDVEQTPMGFDPDQFWFAEDDDEERKQQDLELPELREKHSDKEYGDYTKGKAFVQGGNDNHEVDPNDVSQGALGDCYLMAGMIAVARANPDAIKDIIKDNGDGTFDVTLFIRDSWYGNAKPKTVTIDARLPEKYKGTPLYAKLGDKTDAGDEMWPALLEKAVAQEKGSYELISGGNIGKDGFKFAGATEMFTGRKEGYQKTDGMDGDTALLTIIFALEDKKPCTTDSRNMESDEALAKDAKKYNVYGNHAYVPESVDLDGRTIDLTNPWGSHHVKKLPVNDFLRFYRSIRVGA